MEASSDPLDLDLRKATWKEGRNDGNAVFQLLNPNHPAGPRASQATLEKGLGDTLPEGVNVTPIALSGGWVVELSYPSGEFIEELRIWIDRSQGETRITSGLANDVVATISWNECPTLRATVESVVRNDFYRDRNSPVE